ncbi:MAG: hypothetical protein V2A74_04280 [bacterium]
MPTLHVRNVPEKLYRQIQEVASGKSQSLSAAVVSMLDEAVEDQRRRSRQGRVLAQIRRRRFAAPEGTPSSLTLLREDRRR